MKYLFFILNILLFSGSLSASNIANPATTSPEARITVGASYHLGGYTITNAEIASMWNRFHGRVEYTPLKFLSFGASFGATQIEVDRFNIGNDTMPAFHGNYGFSGGAHLKLTSPPFLNKTVRLTSICHATIFSSENDNGAIYSGKDGAGMVGLQFHIPGFGYITTGPLVYIIEGLNKSYSGTENFYSNSNNIRGWIAIDYFPKMKNGGSNKPYVSVELSASPAATVTKRTPVKEFSISISIGSVTKRLYGVENDIEWEP